MNQSNSLSVITQTESYCLQVKIAQSNIEILECQNLIAAVYYENFGISLSDRSFDTKAKIELYPHYYLMGVINDELVATIGMYLYNINSQQYTYVTEPEIAATLNKAGLNETVSLQNKREFNKFAVKKAWRNTSLSKVFLGLAHCKDFIHLIGDDSHILVNTAFGSVFKILDSLGIESQLIKTIPANKVYSNYPSDRYLETRLTVPFLDIPSCWYDFKLPGEYPIEI